MEYFKAKKVILSYLKNNFRKYKINKRLSEFAYTFDVIADGGRYVIKLVERKNIVSKIIHDERHIKCIVKVSKEINDNNKNIKTIYIVDFLCYGDCSLLLTKKEKISKIKIKATSGFKLLGEAILSFHLSCAKIQLQKSRWNNFPSHFISTLHKHGRWKEIERFLVENKKYINLKIPVVCHNDIHKGNVYLSKKNIIFLDIDDICMDSHFNDLGMAIANFTNSTYSKRKLLEAIKFLLIGYCEEISRNSILNVLLFTLRKLYFTEAYFLYSQKENAKFIGELRKRQKLIVSIFKNYL